MPRRNLQILLFTVVFSLLCAFRSSPYGRALMYALEQIHQKALEPRTQKELAEAALRGMANELDPYSAYISAEELAQFDEELDRQFGGVGIEIHVDPDTRGVIVTTALPGTPAQRGGIRPGDRLLAVDGQDVSSANLDEVSRLVRGLPGSQVVLTVQSRGETEPRRVTLTREIIQGETVLGDTRNADGTWNYTLRERPDIGFIRIDTFADETDDRLREVLRQLMEKGVRGIILDLRSDPGGRLDVAVEVCDAFLRSGVIVTTQTRTGVVKERFAASGKAVCPDTPLAVLINRYSASASEIVAACLQDHGRAVIVGERSFGKGTVQELLDMEPGLGRLKLTTASYRRPSGKNIHRSVRARPEDDWGVRPDPGYEVPLDEKEVELQILARALRGMYRTAESPKPVGFENVPDDFRDRHVEKALEYFDRIKTELKTTSDRLGVGG
ncbi:MAG: S41 family peptidase [Thermogutta sp.]|nr:S41 family peptidase [Thermogutta sp.]